MPCIISWLRYLEPLSWYNSDKTRVFYKSGQALCMWWTKMNRMTQQLIMGKSWVYCPRRPAWLTLSTRSAHHLLIVQLLSTSFWARQLLHIFHATIHHTSAHAGSHQTNNLIKNFINKSFKKQYTLQINRYIYVYI